MGNVAVQAAKLLGAARVVAAAHGGERLERMRDRGADALVDLDTPDDLAEKLKEATDGGADVIVDPLWGGPAVAAVGAAALGARHLQIGHMASPSADVPALTVRSATLNLLGFVVFRVPLDVRRDAYRRLTEHAARGDIEVDLERVPLDDVEDAWRRQESGPHTKLVVVP